MKKSLLLAALLFTGISAKAQTNVFTEIGDFLSPLTQASNHTIFLGGGEDLTKHQGIGVVGDVFNFSKNFGMFIDLRFEAPDALSGVSGSLMFQVPIYPFGGTNFAISPNVYAGIMTHFAGYGPQDGTADVVAGGGGTIRLWKWINVWAEYETVQNAKSDNILGGVAAKLYAGDGTGAFGRKKYLRDRALARWRSVESY